MGIGQFLKNTVKNNANVKGWTSWDAIKENGRVIKGFVADIESGATVSAAPITFEEAMKKYNLSEKDISQRMRTSFMAAVFCLFLAVVALGWTVYLMTKTMYLSALVGFALAVLMSSYGFREHFHYFQMKSRRLNCTWKEWLSGFLLNKK